MTAARTVLAHALCQSAGADCTCSRDPYEPACEWLARRADVLLHWPVERRMRLVQAIAAGEGATAAPGLHTRLAETGIAVPVPEALPAPAGERPSLNLDGTTEPPATEVDAVLTEEQRMRRAAGHAWRA